MAKRKPDADEFKEEENFEQAIEKDGEVVVVTDKSHLKPQAERTEPEARPAAIHPSHLKPMEEVKHEERKVKAVKPEHAKPQE